MESIRVIDRETGRAFTEEVYGGASLRLLYGDGALTRFFGAPLLRPLAATAWFARLFGWLQSRPSSKKKVLPFIERYGVDASEFLEPPESYPTFNDFFIRKLKPGARPLPADPNAVVCPADGRYRFFPNGLRHDWFQVKERPFTLDTLLGSSELADRFRNGPICLARLCPVDYHRFHFPAAGVPTESTERPGPLLSVNPIAINHRSWIFQENRRQVSLLKTTSVGAIGIVEIGATCVGTIHQTYQSGKPVARGEEKGYFSFGGSAMLLLFEPDRFRFAPDLLELAPPGNEIFCKMGSPLGA